LHNDHSKIYLTVLVTNLLLTFEKLTTVLTIVNRYQLTSIIIHFWNE